MYNIGILNSVVDGEPVDESSCVDRNIVDIGRFVCFKLSALQDIQKVLARPLDLTLMVALELTSVS